MASSRILRRCLSRINGHGHELVLELRTTPSGCSGYANGSMTMKKIAFSHIPSSSFVHSSGLSRQSEGVRQRESAIGVVGLVLGSLWGKSPEPQG